MAIVSFANDPVQGILTLQRELERFLGKPYGFDLGPSAGGIFPPVNVFRSRDALVVKAEVPGVDPATIQVSVEGRTLTIAGERTPSSQKASFHRRERRFGKFSRSLQLPDDVDATKSNAECRNGVLTLKISKREEAQPRQIRVEAA
jgi:HSP20 family protein